MTGLSHSCPIRAGLLIGALTRGPNRLWSVQPAPMTQRRPDVTSRRGCFALDFGCTEYNWSEDGLLHFPGQERRQQLCVPPPCPTHPPLLATSPARQAGEQMQTHRAREERDPDHCCSRECPSFTVSALLGEGRRHRGRAAAAAVEELQGVDWEANSRLSHLSHQNWALGQECLSPLLWVEVGFAYC